MLTSGSMKRILLAFQNDMNQEQRQDAFRAKTFRMMLAILGIFGIPVSIVFFVGRYLEQGSELSSEAWLGLLAVSFVFSWILIIRMYIRLERERKDIDTSQDTTDI